MKTIKIANRSEVRVTKAGNVHSADLSKIFMAYIEAASSKERQWEYYLLVGENEKAAECEGLVAFFKALAHQASSLTAA